ARSRGLDRLEGPLAYTNYRAGPTQLLNLYIREDGAAQGLEEAVTRRFQRLAPQVPPPVFRPLSAARDQWLAPFRLRAALIGLFAVLALAVTLAGVVGMVAFDAGQRRREIGIRAAIGATPGAIVATFMSEG